MVRPTLIDLNPVELRYYPKIKTFNMITNKNEAKAMIFNVTVNANSIVQLAIQFKNGITKLVNVNVKVILHAKRIIVGILAHVFVRKASI